MRPARLTFLYEDDDIIAVDKPAGLPSIAPAGSRGQSAYDLVTERIRRRNPKGRAAVVHRLDRDTSGVMIFARNARAKTVLMGSWNELVLTRRYIALVEGTPPESEGIIDSWLIEHGVGRVSVAPPGTPGALRAVTKYRVLERGAAFCLVELELETGRKHQIRAHLSSIKCPVAGDERYGARADPAGRLCLHATLLELKRPFPPSRSVRTRIAGGSRDRANAPEPPAVIDKDGILRFESPIPDCFRRGLAVTTPKSAFRPAGARGRPVERTSSPRESGHYGSEQAYGPHRGARRLARSGENHPPRGAPGSRAPGSRTPGGRPPGKAPGIGRRGPRKSSSR